MNQIKEKSYYDRFRKNNQSTKLIAVAFDSSQRKVNEWLVEEIMA
jgi:hypothetical protein